MPGSVQALASPGSASAPATDSAAPMPTRFTLLTPGKLAREAIQASTGFAPAITSTKFSRCLVVQHSKAASQWRS